MLNTHGIEISGITCDNPNCTFEDTTVPYEDYDKWLLKPCELCGETLLTEEDYNLCQALYAMAEVVQQQLGSSEEKQYSVTIKNVKNT